MKLFTTTLLATAAIVGATAAHADTRVSIGVNMGTPVYSRPATPVYAPPPAVVYAPAPSVVYAPAAPRGHWEDVTVKTWVPDRWVSSRDRWGRSVRVREAGYFAYRTDRVWVDGRSDHHSHHNAGAYGYNHHDNRVWNR